MEAKIPFYQLLNILLTGLVLSAGIVIFFSSEVQIFLGASKPFWKHSELISSIVFIAVSYEAGLIVNRLGSVLLEPAMIRIGAIPFDKNYKHFNEAKKQYPILEVLSREYASSRTNVVMFLTLSPICFLHGRCIAGFSFLVVAALFFLSWRKHAWKIVSLMKKGKEESN